MRLHNADNTVLTVDRPWDVQPDATSKYTVIRTASDIVVENSTTLDNDKGILFYNCVYDSVCAGMVAPITPWA